ncbi:hypothetical protein FRC09_001141 [Ceratobasidium sp. 395]|nr:hypothetical protein FRC09_001141 [Ceratobasidium sp. 395]
MTAVPDGVYAIQLPNSDTAITDPGEGRYLHLLPHGALGQDADKIKVNYNGDKGAYSLQFEKSKKYLSYTDVPAMNNKLIDGDKPRYFKITKHDYYPDQFVITAAEDKNYHVGMALERIYPPWVALSSFPEKQPWSFKGAY